VILKREATISKNWFTNFKKYFSGLVTAANQARGDRFLLFIVLAMVLFGLLMVYSSSFIFSEERTGDGFAYIRKQLIYASMGFMAMWVSARIPHQKWYQWAPTAIISVFVMLVLVLIPGVGARVGGAQRWINFRDF